MKLIALAQNSDEWELAYWEEIFPSLSFALDERNPGYATRFNNELNEGHILEIFNDCCNKAHYEIAMSEDNNAYLVKRSDSQIVAREAHLSMLSMKESKIIGNDQDNDLSTYEKIIKKAVLSRFGVQKEDQYAKKDESKNLWEFPDGSCLKQTGMSIQTWSKDPEFKKEEFNLFINIMKNELNKAMKQEMETLSPNV